MARIDCAYALTDDQDLQFDSIKAMPFTTEFAGTQGGFFDFGSFAELAGNPNDAVAHVQRGFLGWAGKGGSLFLWNREKNVGFAYTMSGMMNGGHGGPRTAPFFDVLRHA